MSERQNSKYWRTAYETLVAQTGRDLNDGLGIDPRRKGWLPPLAEALSAPATARDSGSLQRQGASVPDELGAVRRTDILTYLFGRSGICRGCANGPDSAANREGVGE